jgi:hypothetical protein
MADAPQTTALIKLAQTYAPEIVRQINRKTAFLRLVPVVVGEGKNCSWIVEGDGQDAQVYAEGADVSDWASDAQAEAILSWSQYRAAARITGLARATARTSHSPQGNRSLVKRNIVNSSAKLASLLNTHCFTGNGAASPKQLTGLDSAIGDDSNVYATIDRSSVTYWRPTVRDPGTPTNLTFALIRDDQRRVEEACGEKPDIAIVEPAVFNVVTSLFDSNRRFVETITTSRGDIKMGGGSAIEVEGTVFVKDKDATAGQIYYLNSEYIALEVLPPADESLPVLEPGTRLTANDGFGDLPLMFTYEKLAKTGDSAKFFAKAYAELKIERPNAFAVRKNVKTAA